MLEDLVDALSLPAGLRGCSSSVCAFMPKTEEHLLLLPSIFIVGGACEDCVSDPKSRCQNLLRVLCKNSSLGLHPAANG